MLKTNLISKGTYVSVEDEHLDRYIDEQSFRYNTRKDTDYERFEKAVSGGVEGKKITYAHTNNLEALKASLPYHLHCSR